MKKIVFSNMRVISNVGLKTGCKNCDIRMCDCDWGPDNCYEGGEDGCDGGLSSIFLNV